MQLIDIHCHILPKVDDGPDTVEESRKILEEAYRQGVRCIIATPHYRPEMFESSMRKVVYSYRNLREIADDIGITLCLGCEYYRNDMMITHLKNRNRPTMSGGKYVLVEFSTHDMFQIIRKHVYDLTAHGYKPIIAHVERYFCCQEIKNILELRELGAYIQVNAGSVNGEAGLRIKKFCLQLMKEDLVDFIASDTHNTRSRKMNLKKCAQYVTRKMGRQYANRIFVSNPLNILKSR